MSRLELVLRYSCFAVIATLVNLASQRLVLFLTAHDFAIVAAIAAGTATGLIVKYALDKRWIFNDMSNGLRTHSKKFGLYTMMGLFTTAIFWGFETGFWFIWETTLAREAGAIIGLGIGYIIKYQLDRKFVFETAQA